MQEDLWDANLLLSIDTHNVIHNTQRNVGNLSLSQDLLWTPRVNEEQELYNHTISAGNQFNNFSEHSYHYSHEEIKEIEEFNDFSKSEELIAQNNISHLQNAPAQQKKRGRKTINSGMIRRKDVILKSVLRKIRSSIRKSFFTYLKDQKERWNKSFADITKLLGDFISNLKNETPEASIVETLGVFIWAEKFESSLDQIENESKRRRIIEGIKEVKETLYKFNFSRFTKLLNLPGLPEIILHICQIQNHDSLTNDEKLGLQILLKEWWNKSLTF